MANPQPTDAHLRIAHSINEQLMVSHFSEQQRRMLDLILRLSWGCGNKVAHIPHQRDFAIVGVLEGHVKAHLDWLSEARVIIRDDCFYQFNKDFDQWRVSRAVGYSKKRLTEIVRLNLNHKKPELTEKGSENLRKREDSPYVFRKQSSPDLATPKEMLKKVLKKEDKVVHPQNELADFDIFWKAYPKRKSKGDAERAFKKISPDEKLLLIIITAIERAKKTDDWLKAEGQYIPYPATWLNAKGWEDEVQGEGHGKDKGHSQQRRLPKTYRTPEQHFGAKDA